MLDLPDPLADLILGKLQHSMIGDWLKFLFELAFSAVVTFLFICGSVLVASKSYTIAIGSGMVAAAISLTVLFRREQSKLTKGMLVVLPSAEAAQEIATDLQTIQKSQEK